MAESRVFAQFDDDLSRADILKNFIESMGHKVPGDLRAETEEHAIEIINSFKLHHVFGCLLDGNLDFYELDNAAGYRLMAQMRRISPDVHIISVADNPLQNVDFKIEWVNFIEQRKAFADWLSNQ